MFVVQVQAIASARAGEKEEEREREENRIRRIVCVFMCERERDTGVASMRYPSHLPLFTHMHFIFQELPWECQIWIQRVNLFKSCESGLL